MVTMAKYAINKLPKNVQFFIRDRGGHNFNGVRVHVSLIKNMGASATCYKHMPVIRWIVSGPSPYALEIPIRH